jgi:hypothetical protein
MGTLLLLPATPALAHAEHDEGDLVFAVGFADEPAYAGQPNAATMIVTHHEEPVTDLAPGDLEVEIGFGGQTTVVEAVPAFEVGEWGTPGEYRAPFIPSEPGAYTFHVTGTVDGEAVDFSMTSGAKTFDEVQDPAAAMFPAMDSPTNTDLATKIDQGDARADAAIASANDAVDQARLVALIAVVVAIVALGLAIAALRGRKGSAAA